MDVSLIWEDIYSLARVFFGPQHDSAQRQAFGDFAEYGFIYYYLAAIRETLFFRRASTNHKATVPSQSTMDPAKLAKLQAQAASNRIGTSIGHIRGVIFASCVCGICASVRLADCQLLRVRREGHRAAKDCAQVEARELTGRQEAAGCAEEAERAADHGRRGGQHVQGGRKRVALQCSQRSVLVFSFFFSPPVVDCIVWGLTLWRGGVATTRY